MGPIQEAPGFHHEGHEEHEEHEGGKSNMLATPPMFFGAIARNSPEAVPRRHGKVGAGQWVG